MMSLKALVAITIALLGSTQFSIAMPAPGSCDGQNGNKQCFQPFNFDISSCQCNFECVLFPNQASGCCQDYLTV